MNIINFPDKKKRESPLKPQRHEVLCSHQALVADEKTRMLECKKCGALIDPFDYIYNLSIECEKVINWYNKTDKELKKLRKELEDLKKDEHNTKMRLKRAKQQIRKIPGF